MARRGGKRKKRDQRKPQFYRLKYYLILTDAEKTEVNYFNGLKKSLPFTIKDKIEIEVIKAKTPYSLIEEAKNISSKKPQFREVWLVFDRDEVKGFDKIITDAQENNFEVGWSNPCIEIWFHAYFGEMPVNYKSTQCVDNFSKKYQHIVNQKYNKNDPDIYNKLFEFGDEKIAIKISKDRLTKNESNKCRPSEMFGTTRVFKLMEEIRNIKISKQ